MPERILLAYPVLVGLGIGLVVIATLYGLALASRRIGRARRRRHILARLRGVRR